MFTAIEINGFTATATIVQNDYHNETPWDNEDGHGPVSEWTSRDKAPGELVLREDRGSNLFYDYAEACRIARRDNWGSDRTSAADAARADYERLRAWCNGDWHYVGVQVTVSRDGIELANESLWGIESDAGDYPIETANELLQEALVEAADTIERLTCR